MKGRKAVTAVFITALVVTIILITMEGYYIAIALVAGTLLIGHREI